jgi:hypothetical protein
MTAMTIRARSRFRPLARRESKGQTECPPAHSLAGARVPARFFLHAHGVGFSASEVCLDYPFVRVGSTMLFRVTKEAFPRPIVRGINGITALASLRADELAASCAPSPGAGHHAMPEEARRRLSRSSPRLDLRLQYGQTATRRSLAVMAATCRVSVVCVKAERTEPPETTPKAACASPRRSSPRSLTSARSNPSGQRTRASKARHAASS